MSFSLKNSLFNKIAYGICLIFILVMGFAGYKAYSRRSGNTGLDMGKIQKMRYEANFKR